jgi:hypothetical protein
MKMTTILFGLVLLIAACSDHSASTVELRHFPLDDFSNLIAQSGVAIDSEVSADGNASLRIDAEQPVTVRLYELREVEVDDATLMYQARVRTHNMQGEVYLEMWCGFSGQGEFFSRDLETPLTGTTDWSTKSTPFYLQKGQKPDYIKLNLVINGIGKAWIDDIRLFASPRPAA